MRPIHGLALLLAAAVPAGSTPLGSVVASVPSMLDTWEVSVLAQQPVKMQDVFAVWRGQTRVGEVVVIGFTPAGNAIVVTRDHSVSLQTGDMLMFERHASSAVKTVGPYTPVSGVVVEGRPGLDSSLPGSLTIQPSSFGTFDFGSSFGRVTPSSFTLNGFTVTSFITNVSSASTWSASPTTFDSTSFTSSWTVSPTTFTVTSMAP